MVGKIHQLGAINNSRRRKPAPHTHTNAANWFSTNGSVIRVSHYDVDIYRCELLLTFALLWHHPRPLPPSLILLHP